jgi:nitric oxide reductase subunit B
MLVYGISMHLMEKLKGESKMNYSKTAFLFFFLGFTNLLFNWGHHTYIVPAAPWVKTVAYVISMTELLIFGQLVWKFRKTMSEAQKNFHFIPYRLLSFADGWIFLNLGAAIAISIPALNYYTHGTHITVAHAMGTTIGINTMLLFAAIFYILLPKKLNSQSTLIKRGIWITNIALIVFWFSLIGSGLVKISAKLHNRTFYQMMEACQPFFKLFTFSGIVILFGLILLILAAFRLIIQAGRTKRY